MYGLFAYVCVQRLQILLGSLLSAFGVLADHYRIGFMEFDPIGIPATPHW